MFYCPTCGKEYETEDEISRHYMKCWKQAHPYAPKSKPAPRSEDVNTRTITSEIEDFFNSFR